MAHLRQDAEHRDALGMDPQTMRELGYWVVDRVVDHVSGIESEPAILAATPESLRDALGGPLPEAPGDPHEALALLAEVALPNMQHVEHPRYFARVPSPSSFSGVLGEWLGTGFNAVAQSWSGGSGPTSVELTVIEWLAELVGLPPGSHGVLLSGGSMANLTALVAARHARGPGVAYLTSQTHAAIARALRSIGFGEDEIREVPCDAGLRLDPTALRAQLELDRSAGLVPRIVVATAGTTNSGAVDPLPELGKLCAEESLWLHVDGAYGAPAAMCPAGRSALPGLERADSLVLDPHKWLFQPIDCGALLVRHAGVLEAAFTVEPEYLRDIRSSGGEVDMRDRSLELTRRARALKVWLTLRIHGAARLRDAAARGIALAEYAEARLRSDDRWEVVTPAQLGIVTFALRDAAAGEHAARAAALAAEGFAAVTSTFLEDRSVLRLCTINPRATEADVDATLERLAAVPAPPRFTTPQRS